MKRFEIRIPGKWVLTGEHAVLRGIMAIALPHPEFCLDLGFIPEQGSDLKVKPTETREFVVGLAEAALELMDQARPTQRATPLPSGILTIRSSIPLGAGLGSSAALCVAMVRWLNEEYGLPLTSHQENEIATRLEDRFHGRSSGMDVAVVSIGKPISYRVQELSRKVTTLELSRLPRFTFHDTGLRMRTSECVAKVEAFRLERSDRAASLDLQMAEASHLALNGLTEYRKMEKQSDSIALQEIKRAMELGQDCFRQWGLLPDLAEEIESRLVKEGALAVKLTGAGGGGYLVALWSL